MAKASCGVWFGDSKLVSKVGSNAIDLVAQRLTHLRDQRRFRRVWEEAAELIAYRVLALRQLSDIPSNERGAAIDAVQDTFNAAALTEEDLFKAGP